MSIKFTSVALLLFVLIAFNCSNLKKNATNTNQKNQTSHNEDHKIFDNMKQEFSNISSKLTKFEEEAKAEFSKKMPADQEEKLMNTLGKKIKNIGHLADQLHRKFKNFAMSGKLNKEFIEVLKEKFHGMKDRFEIIEKMGDEKEAELRKRKPDAKVHSFVQILHKKNQTIPEKEEKIEEKEEKIEEKNAEKEGNMEKMKGAISEILRNLTNFETEAALQFHQENMTIENEEKLMKSLGKKLNKIVKFARHLHLKFNHYLKEKDGKISKEVIEAIHEKFQHVQDKFELIFQMGESKIKEIMQRRREENSGENSKNETKNGRPHNETRHRKPHKRERRTKNETRPERHEKFEDERERSEHNSHEMHEIRMPIMGKMEKNHRNHRKEGPKESENFEGKNDDQEEHGQGLRPQMEKGKGKNSHKMMRPPMGKHPRPPIEENHKNNKNHKNPREEGPRGSEHFEGKNIDKEKNEKNDQNQEEPGQGIQGLKPPMQMGKGKNSNKMIRHPMGKHPRPPMEKNHKNHKEEGSRGFEHFEGKKIVEEKNDQEKHGYGFRPPMPAREEKDGQKLNQKETSFWKHLDGDDDDNDGEEKEEKEKDQKEEKVEKYFNVKIALKK